MHAAACESGTDAWGELQRRGQHRAFQSDAFLIVIRISKKKAAISAARIDELRRLNLSVLYEISLVKIFVDNEPNLIARLNLRIEIDLPLVHFGQFCGEVLALRVAVECVPKGALDMCNDRF